MSDNKNPQQQNTSLMLEWITNRDIVSEMKESYLSYAMSVIISRALPDVRDWLKPVHRRILYAMYKLGITPWSRYVKSARVVWEVIGKYHPHWDTAVYDSMVRMAQDFSMRYELVKWQWNFGSIDWDNAAAMRYTEVKMQKITPELITDIEKNTVAFRDNYDWSLKEPCVFPSRVPWLLLNGTMGIAVWMATNIPPNNITELCNAVIHLVNNENAAIDDLLEIVKWPDFPTAWVIYDVEAIKNAYRTWRWSIIMRWKAEIEELKWWKAQIIITELPYQVNKANLTVKISELVNAKTIVWISEVRDESNKEWIRVVIEIKRDAFPNKILNQLFQLTQLQSSFWVNLVALVENGMQPKLLNLKDILEEFIKHRVEVITNRTKYELDLAEKRKHILDWLKKALDSIDEIIKTIRASKTKEEAKVNLIQKFKFTDVQADAILAMRLQTLAWLERKKIEDELAEKIKFIAECKDILSKPARIKQIIKDETQKIIDVYWDERRTEIVQFAPGKFSATDVVPNIPVVVTVSEKWYIKRVPENTYTAQNRGWKWIKWFEWEEDVITHLFQTKNHNNLLFFTDFGRCFKLAVHEIPQASRTARGQALVNFLQLDKDESVTAVLDITASQWKYLFMATTDWTVKKTELEEFKNVRSNWLIAIKLEKWNFLKWVKITSWTDQIMLITREWKSIRYEEWDVRSVWRTAMWVRWIRLQDWDGVVEMDAVTKDSVAQLLVVMENGLSKTTDINEYRLQSRWWSWVKVANLTSKTGKMAWAKIIKEWDESDLLLISSKWLIIRMKLEDIPSKWRATQWVIIMRMNDPKDKVMKITLIPKEEVWEGGAEEAEAEEVE